MRRAVADALLSMPEHHRFTKGLFAYVGFRTKWFPHENAERAAGETKWNLKKLADYAFDGILAFSDRLLRLPCYYELEPAQIDRVTSLIARTGEWR